MLVVLGAPKSGTSVLASALIRGGVAFPYCERHPKRMDIAAYPKHECELLSGFFWKTLDGNSWQKGDELPIEPFRLLMRALELHGARVGWKVPQSTFYWAEMREAWPSIEYVGIFRHPKGVIDHLLHHNYTDEETARAAWDRYAEALLAAHDALRFPLFELNQDFSPERVQERLGLNICGDPTYRPGAVDMPSDNWRYHALRERAG